MEIRKALHREEQLDKSTIDCGPGLTEQSHAKETDINYILRDYAKTGFMKHAKDYQGMYDDVAVNDFQEAMFIVTNAQNMFNELPADLRKRFGHDPAEFLSFVQNPNNVDEMAKLGILKGNDGLDISGTAVNVPTRSHYQQKVQEANNPPPEETILETQP